MSTPAKSITCELSQGSPVSPIPFMLYISPLFQIGQVSKKFGYADDMAMLATENSLHENRESLQRFLEG